MYRLEAATPKLTLSGASGLTAATGMKATLGYAGETPGQFTVKGENLTANVTVGAPTGFEVSTDGGSSWGTSKTIDKTTAGLSTSGVTVKVRLKSTATGNPSGNVTVSSTGATSRTQSVSGSMYAAPGLSETTGSPSGTMAVGDIEGVTVSDYVTGSATTYSLTTVPDGLTEDTDYTFDTSNGELVFQAPSAGTYTFVVTVQNAAADTHGTATYTWTATVVGCDPYWLGGVCDGSGNKLTGELAVYNAGDALNWEYFGAITTDTRAENGWGVDYGVGKTTDGSGATWEWHPATFAYYDNPNRWWKTTTNGANAMTFASAGKWYVSMRFTNGPCTWYVPGSGATDGAWKNTTAGEWGTAAAYFTVAGLTVSPTTLTVGSTNPAAGSAKTFTITGEELGENAVTVTLSNTSDFQIRNGTSGSYDADGTFEVTAAQAEASGGRTISVRLKAGLTAGTKNATITVTSSAGRGFTNTVTVTGTVVASAPAVTGGYRNVGVTNAEFSLCVTNSGGAGLAANQAGVVYSSTATTPTVGGSGCTSISYTGTPDLNTTYWLANSAKLVPGTLYYYRAYAKNTALAAYGYSDAGSFTTECFGAPTVWPTGKTSSATFDWSDTGATRYALQVWQTTGGTATTTTNKDTLDQAFTGISGSGYTAWSGKHDQSDAWWDGKSSAGTDLQLNSTSPNGLWTTNSGGRVTKVKVSWNSGTSANRVLQVFGKDGAYASGDLYNSSSETKGTLICAFTNATGAATEFTITGTYSNIGIRSSSSALYMESIEVTWEKTSGGPVTTYYHQTAGGTSETSGVEVTGLSTGEEYCWSLEASGGECPAQTVTGVVSTASSDIAPSFEKNEQVTGTVTVGETYLYTNAASGFPRAMTYTPSCTSENASLAAGLYSVDGSGVFSFAPTTAGTYVFTVTAANGVSPDATYTNTVTVNAAAPTLGSPTAGSETAEGATVGATLTGTGGTGMSEWGIVYSASSVNANPTVGGLGCTNVEAAGPISLAAFTKTLTGLSACTEYKWRAYAVNDAGLTGYTDAGTFTTLDVAGPVLGPTAASSTASSITVYWTDSAGASSYVVQIATNDQFSAGGSPAAVFTEAFSSIGDSANENTEITSSMDTYADESGWTGYKVYLGGGGKGVKLGSGSSYGYILSREITLAVAGKVTFRPSKYGSDTDTFTVWQTIDGTDFKVGEDITPDGELHELDLAAGTFTLQFETDSGRAYIDDITVTPNSGGDSASIVETSDPVGSGVGTYTSQVTLDSGTPYYYRVQATSLGGCSAWSTTGTVTTTAANAAPGFTVDEVEGVATVGDLTLGTYQLTKTPDTGFPRTYTYTVATVSVGGEVTAEASSGYSINRDTGAFSFTPTAGGTYKFTVTAANNYGGSDHTGSYTVTVTVTPRTPSIGAPLTAGGGMLSGTVSGLGSGATVLLRRYGSTTDAGNDADGTSGSGTTVTVTSGAFADNDGGNWLTGCSTYYYKVRQTENGQPSAWSDVVGGSPSVGAMGTVAVTNGATSLGFGWEPVAGAAGYKVEACLESGEGEAPDSYEGEGTFTEITSTNDFTDGGFYVLLNGTTGKALNGTVSSSTFGSTDVSSILSGGTLTNPTNEVVWYAIEYQDGSFGLQNVGSGKFATGSSGTGVSAVNEGSMTSYSYWWVSSDHGEPTSTNGVWRFKNDGAPARALFPSGDSWKNYDFSNEGTSNYRRPRVFKLTGGGSSCVSETTTANYHTLTGLESGETYTWTVTPYGASEGCTGDPDTGTAETTGTPTAPTFDPSTGETNTVVGTEVEVTLPKATGFPKAMTYTMSAPGGVGSTEWSFDGETREFSFTSAAVGDYVFTLTARNTTGTGTYALTVHAGAGVPTIAATSAVPSSTSAELTATGVNMMGAASTSITLEYGSSDSYGSTAEVTPSSLAAGTTNGSLSATLTGLTTGSTYYYRWTVASTGGTATATGSFETRCIDAPLVSAWHSGHTLQLSWSPVAGAEGYKVEVSTDSEFAGAAGEGTTVASTGSTLAEGWSYVNGASAASGDGVNYHKLVGASGAGVVSEAFSTLGKSRMTLNYSVATFGSWSGTMNTLTVSYSLDDGETWTPMDSAAEASSGKTYVTSSMEMDSRALGQASVRVKWSAEDATGSAGLRVKDLSVTGYASGSTAGTTANPAVVTTNAATGKLVWEWTADEDGNYYYRVTAKATSCEDAPSAIGGPVDLSEAAVLSIGEPTTTTIPWTLTPQEAWAGWVLVWKADGDFGTPVDGAEPGSAGDPFAGGTIVQKGAGGSTNAVTGTQTGLHACERRYYKVFAYASGYVWDTTLHAEMGTTAEPLPPTGVAATDVGKRQFTVVWTPAANDGAARYELTVTKGAIETGTTTVTNSDFTSGVPEGWTSNNYVSAESGATRLASNGNGGSVTSDPLNLAGNDGKATLTVRAKQYNTDYSTLTVWVQAGSGPWMQEDELILDSDAKDYPVALTNCNASTKIKLSATAGHRVYLYSVLVEQDAGSSEETTVLAPTNVTSGVVSGSGSWTVTGLEEYTEYHFGVRAVGAGCDGDWVTNSVTTAAGPMIGTIPTRLSFGVTSNNVAATKTLVVTNSGHGPLSVTGVSFSGTLLGTDPMVVKENGSPVAWPRSLDPGGSLTLTVTWTPTTGGTLAGTMTLTNNTEGLESFTVPLTGTSRDPMSEPPAVTGYEVRGPADRENTVWDDHLKKTPAEGHEVTVKVWLHHASGIVTNGANAPTFKIYDAEETTLKASGSFTGFREVHRNERDEMECTATVSGWSGDATPGTYRVQVTARSANDKAITDEDTAMPVEGYYELDRFDRRDEEGNVGHGWTIKTATDADEVVALKDGRLVINGSESGQPGANGRGGVVRDMQGGGYATEWGTAQSQLTWAFNFAGGRQTPWATFAGGNYAGAFVLGATSENLFGEGTTCAGYAVVMRDGKVQLARMGAGLSGEASLTVLGSGYPVADGRQAIGVKVTFVPASSHEGDGGATVTVPAKLMLFVKEWEGRGASAITGDSVTGHGVAYETVELGSETDAALLASPLRYVGMAWNHASSPGGDTTYGAFDDVYVPHEEGNGVPMEFDVADEDIEGPVFSDFNARGAFTYSQIPAGGLSITGLVADASGVYAASNRWVLYSNETEVARGSFTPTPGGNGAATNVALSGAIGKSYFTDTGTFTNYVLVLESTDYDTDWVGDETTASKRYHFTVTDQVLTEPTGVTADADGAEMTVVRWSASGNWVVIMQGTNAIPEDWTPPQGTNLETGDELDGPDGAKFRVAYVGNGTWVNMGGEGPEEDYRCSEATELTVAPGATNYYRVYGTAMGYYGKGIAPTNYPVKSPKYEKGEIVESFSYPDKVVPGSVTEDQWKWASDFSLDRQETGAGWDGPWYFGDGQSEGLDGHAWKIHDGGLLGGTTEFPAGIANKLFWNDKWAEGSEGSKDEEYMWMKRKLASPMNSGKIFVAFQMNYQFKGTGKHILVTLTGGAEYDDEIVGFGMTGDNWDSDANGYRYASLTIPSSVTPDGRTWNNRGEGGSIKKLEAGDGEDYVIVGELDLSENKVRLWAYDKNTQIPQEYDPATMGGLVTTLDCTGLAGKTVTGVKIGMGSPAGSWMGQAYLDELRLGKTWDETLLFNKPVVYKYEYGVTNGVDKEGHTLYKISDGQLAGNDPLNMNFTLYHRSGIQSADVRVLDPFASGETTLAGWQALTAGSGAHWTNYWTASAVNTDHINLASNYTVQVKMEATGGKTNLVSSAEEGGGATATDLFIGEYGEGEGYDKYIELYNGLEEDIDLREYYVARMWPPSHQSVAFGSMTNYTTQGKFKEWARVTVSSDPDEYLLPKHSTVVLLNHASGSNIARMGDVLTRKGYHWILMTNEVLDAGGDVPILLFKKDVFEGTTGIDGGSAPANSPTNKPWLDACGFSKGVSDHYIMSRKVESEVLPRSCPLLIEHDEWDYRRWGLDSSDNPEYTDFLTTAGQYDRNIGLGGSMEFTVYDDDTEPPTIGSGSKVRIGASELAAQAGTTETVLTGWTFCEDGNSSAVTTNAWGRSMLTNATITVGPRYTAWLALKGKALVRKTYTGADVNLEFGGITVQRPGYLVVEPDPDWLTAGDDFTWVRFRFGMVKAEDRMFSFADLAKTSNSFSSATLEWSTTGRDADDEWTAVATWNPREETNTWTLRSFDLSESASGIPADVATLYLRVKLSGFSGQGSMWMMDNVQLTGYPDELRVSDKDLHENGFSFDANVYDESGVDRAGMKVTIGPATNTPSSWATGDGVSTDSLARVTFAAVADEAEVTEWYTQSLSGLLHVGLEAKDLDDDRTVGGANVDQETAEGHFGILHVYDDDEDKPVVEMTGMRAVGGTNMVQWKFTQEGSLAPTAWDDALAVSRLGAKTDGSPERSMHWLSATNAPGAPTNTLAFGVRQNGWQHGTKYWYFTVTPSTNTQIKSMQMCNHINSQYGPTYFTVTVLQGGAAAYGPTAPTYFLGDAEAAWASNTNQLNTWIYKSLSVNWTLEKGKTYEFRIQGYGASKRQGVGAWWGVYDLQLGGNNSETNGMTFKTDADLRTGGSDWLHGSVYDTYSGLDATPLKTPKFALTDPAGKVLATNQPLSFTESDLTDSGQKKSAAEGKFTGVVPEMGYTDRKLGTYGGWVSAWDADADRTEDSLEAHVALALTVVDNDVTPPGAPSSLKVNNVPVPGTAPTRDNVTWTNKPEFLVSFDVAEDVEPTTEQLADTEWLEAHGIPTNKVKQASLQTGVTGIGEYRVSLTTDAAALADAPAFTVAVTNGALANSGFERLNTETETRYQAWTLTDNGGIRSAGERAFSGSPTVTPVPYEGTNCLFVPSGTVGGTGGGGALGAPQSQVIVFTNTAHVTPRVGGSFWYYKDNDSSSPRLRISAYSNETMIAADRIGFRVVNPATDATSAGEWHKADVEFTEIGNGNANCILVELYSGTQHSFFDDVRIGVDVGAGNKPTMVYVPDAAGQGLNVKHLFAVDADNDRAGDRLTGPAASFYTAYDITPPTPVAFKGHGSAGASTDHVDDPTTQFDLSWVTSEVGPDNPASRNHPEYSTREEPARNKNMLSPWGTYKVYYGIYDPIVAAAYTNTVDTSRRGAAAYIEDTFIALGSTNCYTNWPSRQAGDEIEDPAARNKGITSYTAITNMSTNGMCLYDLDFDQEYVVVVVGVDKAGNEGPANASSWATNNTIKFSMTRGWHMKKADATSTNAFGPSIAGRLTNDVVSALEWTAAGITNNFGPGRYEGSVTKDYDLLTWDSWRFQEHPDNDWKLVGTVHTNWFVDDGGPTNRGSIRFYRASYKDRWRKHPVNAQGEEDTTVNQLPLVSEEVYAQTAIRLRSGPPSTNSYPNAEEGNYNYVALHGVPYTNTFRAVFGGLETFPGGPSAALGTCIDFYTPGTNAVSTESYLLKDDGEWYRDGESTPCSDVLRDRNFFTRAFSISLPYPIPPEYVSGTTTNWHGRTPVPVPYILWKPILQVPTNGFSQEIHCPATTNDPPVYNIVALRLPVATHPSRMKLLEGGFTKSDDPRKADQIYTIDPVTREPGHSCYCTDVQVTVTNTVTNTANVVSVVGVETNKVEKWLFVSGGEVPWDYFKPNDVLVIVSKNTHETITPSGTTNNTWTWTYNPGDFYTLPNRHMQANE